MFAYPASIGCLYVVFSHAIDYLGLEKISPKNINNIRSFLTSLFYYLPLLFISFAITGFFWGAIDFSMMRAIDIHFWNKWVGRFMIGELLIVIFLKFTGGWLMFIKRAFGGVLKSMLNKSVNGENTKI